MDYLMVNIAGIVVIALLLRLITMATKSVLTYPYAFSAAMGLNVFAAHFALNGILLPDVPVLALIYAAWAAFLAGSLLPLTPAVEARLSSRGRGDSDAPIKLAPVNKGVAIALLVLLVFLQLASIADGLQAFGYSVFSGDVLTTFANLRLSSQFQSISQSAYLSIWRWAFVWYIPLALYLFKEKMISIWLLGAVTAVALFSSVTMFTRAPLIQLITIAAVSWAVLYRPDRRLQITLGSIGLAALVIVFLVTQDALLTNDRLSQVSSLSESLWSYAGGPIKAYEQLLSDTFVRQPGFYSLDAINYILARFSIIDSYPDLIRPSTFVGVPLNVYTFLDAYTLDFGVVGAVVGSFLTGIVVGVCYVRLRNKLTYARLVLYAYLVYCCAMAGANNEFIRFSLLLYALLAVVWELVITKTAQPAKKTQRVSRAGPALYYAPKPETKVRLER